MFPVLSAFLYAAVQLFLFPIFAKLFVCLFCPTFVFLCCGSKEMTRHPFQSKEKEIWGTKIKALGSQ